MVLIVNIKNKYLINKCSILLKKYYKLNMYAYNTFLSILKLLYIFYMSYSNSLEWCDRVFTETIIGAGRDYAVVRDSNNHNFLLWTVYLSYVEFREDITLR